MRTWLLRLLPLTVVNIKLALVDPEKAYLEDEARALHQVEVQEDKITV